MPELSRFDGMIVRMLFADTRQHNKPHVHVYCGEYEASVGLDGELLAGYLPAKKFTVLQAWLILREEEVYAAWNNAVRSIPFDKVPPIQ